ncbi:TOBE domain-containing protein, partial [Mesorhizobium sp. M7A.F.Ca.CA.001.14.1.1]
ATTMIYVTHDQIEAMTLADRIVLMRDGLIEQQGAPLELFERPASIFVAGFLGSPRMSFLPGTLALDGSAAAIRLADGLLPIAPGRTLNGAIDGQSVLLGLRPEHLTRAHAATPEPGTLRYDATIDLLQPTGSRSYATFRLAGAPVVAELQAHDVSRPGERLPIDINMNRASIFDAATEQAI